MRGLNALAKEVLRAGINQMKSGVDYLPMQMFPIGSCAQVELVGGGEERGEAVGSRAETSTRRAPLLIEVASLRIFFTHELGSNFRDSIISAPLLIEVGVQSIFSTWFIFTHQLRSA